MSQNLDALELANANRLGRAEWRRRIAGDRDLLVSVLLDPPDDLAGVRLLDLLRWSRRTRPGANRCDSFDRLGARAVRANVNLLMPLGRASRASREWLSVDEFVARTRTGGR